VLEEIQTIRETNIEEAGKGEGKIHQARDSLPNTVFPNEIIRFVEGWPKRREQSEGDL